MHLCSVFPGICSCHVWGSLILPLSGVFCRDSRMASIRCWMHRFLLLGHLVIGHHEIVEDEGVATASGRAVALDAKTCGGIYRLMHRVCMDLYCPMHTPCIDQETVLRHRPIHTACIGLYRPMYRVPWSPWLIGLCIGYV